MQSLNELDWQKMGGLIPAVVQDEATKRILMLGYMNQESLAMTLATKQVTFFSRSKNALWVKGESSGNYLHLCDIFPDCDGDSLLVTARPIGPTCHQGTASCFKGEIYENGEEGDGNPENSAAKAIQDDVFSHLEKTIESRYVERPQGSYVTSLFNDGLSRIAQKVGEEGVEVALAAVVEDKQTLSEEAADLLFHLLVLLRMKDIPFKEVLSVLQRRAVAMAVAS